MFAALPSAVFAAAALLGGPAFAQTSNLEAPPSASQLLHAPVGGTHVPQQKPPATLHNPYEGDARAVAEGRTLFHSMNCDGCHAPQGGGAMGPPLSDNNWIYGGAPSQIFLTIMQGRPNGMPSFANALPEDDIWKLVRYVRSLSQHGGAGGGAAPAKPSTQPDAQAGKP